MDNLNQRVCPHISNTDDVGAMVKTRYGLTVTDIKRLNGYEDCNYHVIVKAEHTNSYIQDVCEHGYLVKIVNFVDSQIQDFNLGQKLVMDHLNSRGIKCQEEVTTVDGKLFSSITEGTGSDAITYLVSVRTFLPGIILDEVTLTSPLAYDVGLLTAKISKAAEGFEFPFYDTFSPPWNMDNFMDVRSVLHAITDTTQKQVAEEVFEEFETKVMPRRDEYRKGLIHGDINEQNVLVDNTSSKVKICGLLDFQDTTISYAIYDLALAVSYMIMMPNSEMSLEDVGGHVLAGYESVFPLNQAERDTLRVIVAARMVMSLVYGAYYHSLTPSNDYLLSTSRTGWSTLFQFWQTADETMWNRWDEIIKSENLDRQPVS